MKTKEVTIGIYAAVSKSGKILLFTGEPVRDEETKSWKGAPYFINSKVYPGIKSMMIDARKTWEDDPEYFEIVYAMTKND